MRIAIVDGQGGGIGRQLAEKIAALGRSNWEVIALGTNALATQNILRGGASCGATGENAIVVNCRRANVILGPVAILLPDAILGEVTPAMAHAIGVSEAEKILIPLNRCGVTVAGTRGKKLNELLDDAIQALLALESK